MDRQGMDEDEIRIMTLGNNRRRHIDSTVSTAHLIKKAVMVPTKSNANFVQQKLNRSVEQPF
jgi:hypothetical protein